MYLYPSILDAPEADGVDWVEGKLALLSEHLKQRGISADLRGWTVTTEAREQLLASF